MRNSIRLTLPNNLLEKCCCLDIGTTTKYCQGDEQGITITLSKEINTTNIHLKAKADDFIKVTSDGYACEVSQFDPASVHDDSDEHVITTAASMLEDISKIPQPTKYKNRSAVKSLKTQNNTDNTTSSQSRHGENCPTAVRKSQRVKRKVTHEDFVTSPTFRKSMTPSLETDDDRNDCQGPPKKKRGTKKDFSGDGSSSQNRSSRWTLRSHNMHKVTDEEKKTDRVPVEETAITQQKEKHSLPKSMHCISSGDSPSESDRKCPAGRKKNKTSRPPQKKASVKCKDKTKGGNISNNKISSVCGKHKITKQAVGEKNNIKMTQASTESKMETSESCTQAPSDGVESTTKIPSVGAKTESHFTSSRRNINKTRSEFQDITEDATFQVKEEVLGEEKSDSERDTNYPQKTEREKFVTVKEDQNIAETSAQDQMVSSELNDQDQDPEKVDLQESLEYIMPDKDLSDRTSSSLECLMCRKKFETQYSLIMHLRKLHLVTYKKHQDVLNKNYSLAARRKALLELHKLSRERLCEEKLGFMNAVMRVSDLESPKSVENKNIVGCAITVDIEVSETSQVKEHQEDVDNTEEQLSKDGNYKEFLCKKCLICQMRCATKAAMFSHIQSSHKLTWPKYVDICTMSNIKERAIEVEKIKNLSQLEALNSHLTSQNMTEQCILCSKGFSDKFKLKVHLFIAHKINYKEHCDVLAEEDPEERKKALGQLIEHSKVQMINSAKHCPICFISMVNSSLLMKHVTTHADHPDYDCIVQDLNKRISIFRNIARDGKTETREDDSEVLCGVCSQKFASKDKVRKHIKNDHNLSWMRYMQIQGLPDEEKQAKIEELRLKVSDSSLKRVTRCIQKDGQVIKCFVCADLIPCGDYRRHLLETHTDVQDVQDIISKMETVLVDTTHHAIQNFSLDCLYCNDKILSADIKKHFDTKHKDDEDGKKKLADTKQHIKTLMNMRRNNARQKRRSLEIQYVCRYCNDPFGDTSSRSLHENYRCKRNADRKQGFFCKYCGQIGRTAEWYEKHVKKHNTKGANYICSLCGRSYTNKSGLNIHKVRDHLKRTNFTCETCGKKFFGVSHYKQHLLKHTSVRSHFCDICGKALKSRVCLKRHIAVVHKQKGDGGMEAQASDEANVHQETLYECSACGKRDVNLDMIKQHRCAANITISDVPSLCDDTSNITQSDGSIVIKSETESLEETLSMTIPVSKRVLPDGSNLSITSSSSGHTDDVGQLRVTANPEQNLQNILEITSPDGRTLLVTDAAPHVTNTDLGIIAASHTPPQSEGNLPLIQEVYVDDGGNIVGTSGNIPTIGTDLQSFMVMKSEEEVVHNEAMQVELPSLVWLNNDNPSVNQ